MTHNEQDVAFWARVDTSGDCWEWVGGRNKDGYGVLPRNGRNTRAHRLAWTLLVGDIPQSRVIDHLCRNRACVNPDHMEIVTRRENTLRGYGPTAQNSRAEHCSRGHVLAGENLRINSYKGSRTCVTCQRGYETAYKATPVDCPGCSKTMPRCSWFRHRTTCADLIAASITATP